jgi:hypothetical protein
LTSICVVLPVTSALMVPLPLSYNLFATDCAKEVISAAVPLEEDNGKHLGDNNSQYQTNIVLQLSDNETVKNATNALTKKHPDNSYIAKIDDNSNVLALLSLCFHASVPVLEVSFLPSGPMAT